MSDARGNAGICDNEEASDFFGKAARLMGSRSPFVVAEGRALGGNRSPPHSPYTALSARSI